MRNFGQNPAAGGAGKAAATSARPEAAAEKNVAALAKKSKSVPEIGGPSGPEPTRYGDWERKGRCIDF
jgi:hypothetical protein